VQVRAAGLLYVLAMLRLLVVFLESSAAVRGGTAAVVASAALVALVLALATAGGEPIVVLGTAVAIGFVLAAIGVAAEGRRRRPGAAAKWADRLCFLETVVFQVHRHMWPKWPSWVAPWRATSSSSGCIQRRGAALRTR